MKKTLLLVSLLASAGCLDPSADGNLVPRTVDDDPELPRVALNGSLFHLETFGDPAAPVIVFLHGGPGEDYRGLLRLRQSVDGERLEDRHFLVFFDQRSSGLSRRHDPGEVTGDAYDADLAGLVDLYSPGRPVVLVGHSWGGMYAAKFIGLHPDRVAGAILMEPGPLTGTRYDAIKGQINAFEIGSEWVNDYAWGQTFVSPDDHARMDYGLLLGMLGNGSPGFHKSTTDRMPVWRLGAVASARVQREGIVDGKATWDFTKGLDRFERPVLFEASEWDEVEGIEFQEEQMTAFARADLAVVPGAGHDHPWVQPEATLRPIFAYLDSIGF